MRTLMVLLLLSIRFLPDVVYAATTSIAEPGTSRPTAAVRWVVSPPAAVVIRPPL